jgi:hypothetical protein
MESASPRTKAYLFLLAIQLFGMIVFIWQELPEFRQIVLYPGKQLPKNTFSDLLMVGIFAVMQASFWIRLRYVPVPFRRSNVFLSHIFLFLGRLSFIFGSALFSVAVFRHLPELGAEANILITAQRGILFVACLFALFCTSVEVERLGQALAP